MIWHGWAQDTFARGGDLVDTDHWYAGRDKVVHVVAFFLLWLALALAPLPLPAQLAIWEAFSCGLEVVEWYRFDAWIFAKDARPWPTLADKPSWRDLFANHAGLALAALYLLLLRGAS